MNKQQGRNALNILKINTTPPKTSGSATARPLHLDAEKAEDNNVKTNFMQIIEGLKEQMKSPLKKWRKRETKFCRNKDLKENQTKATQQEKEMV